LGGSKIPVRRRRRYYDLPRTAIGRNPRHRRAEPAINLILFAQEIRDLELSHNVHECNDRSPSARVGRVWPKPDGLSPQPGFVVTDGEVLVALPIRERESKVILAATACPLFSRCTEWRPHL
jgi:hypothetical protein